jgi:hypothetical protein
MLIVKFDNLLTQATIEANINNKYNRTIITYYFI